MNLISPPPTKALKRIKRFDIEVKQTEYRGIVFRSRTEARWAVFLDHIGAEWEYEPEGFHLASGLYLPDFYIRTWDVFLEIKGADASRLERVRCQQLAVGTRRRVLLASGAPGSPIEMFAVSREDGEVHTYTSGIARCRKCPDVVLIADSDVGYGAEPASSCSGDPLVCGEKQTPNYNELDDALAAARNERFGVFPIGVRGNKS